VPAPEDELPETEELDVLAEEDEEPAEPSAADVDALGEADEDAEPEEDDAPDELDPTDETEEPGEPDAELEVEALDDTDTDVDPDDIDDDVDELDPTDETEEPGDPDPPDDTDDVSAFELLPRDPLKELVEHDGRVLCDARSYQERWNSIQIGFVDEPHYAVESAGRLLAEVLGEVASTFASKRKDLESQWRHDREISTEELRLAFRGYRAFFQRVIAL